MSSPEIEVVEEAEQHEQQEKNDVQPKVDDVDDVQPTKSLKAVPEPNVQPNVQQKVTPDYSTKAVKKLSKDERDMLMNKFNNHEEDPYFKVIRMSDGGIRITKRKIPLNTDIKEVQKMRSSAIENKYKNRLTNEQLIMEHLFDLETRFEAMRLKHKKLKKRYNELESQIYENVDEHDDDVKVVREDKDEQEVKQYVEDEPKTTSEKTQNVSEQSEQPQSRYRVKKSWRDYISYM